MTEEGSKKYIKKDSDSHDKIRKLTYLILEYRTLKHLPRACLPFLKSPIQENVAEHSFYAAVIGQILATTEKGDENKVIKMCLMHDLAEVRGGEKNLINKFYTCPNDEIAIIKEISEDYGIKNLFFPELLEEFNSQKTLEAKIAKDADVLSQMLLEKENLELGNKTAPKWLIQSFIRLKTDTAKKMGKMLIDIKGDEWWLKIDKKYLLKTKFI